MIKLDLSLLVTILYIVILYVVMDRLFFKPITRIKHDRRQLIEGRQESAQARIADVDRKAAEYEQALKSARTEAYRTQEARREEALAVRTQLVGQARAETEKQIREARTRLMSEADTAKEKLDGEVNGLVQELTASLLREDS